MVHGRPGPAPLTAERELFTRLIARGIKNAEACRIVGVNSRTGKRWRHGRTVTSGSCRRLHYPPVISTPELEISSWYLSEDERVMLVSTMAAGLASPAVLVLILVLVRLFDSAKGQPPPAVMVPVVTPAGDLSALAMLAWQLDAVLISALLGAAVVGTFTVWPPAAGAVCVVAIAAVLARVFTRRLRAL